MWKAMGGPPLVREHRFDPVRKWRFDFAHPDSQTAIELEGGVWSGGAHNRGRGFLDDCEKYNAAALAGWTVFRLGTGQVRLPAVKSIALFMEDKESVRRTRHMVHVDGYSITEMPEGVFLMNPIGEAMPYDAAKLAAVLGRIFLREF